MASLHFNAKMHSSKEMAEFCFENADVKSICYSKQRMKSKLSLSLECVKMKLCKPCLFFTSHLHSLCEMVWYRTLRVKLISINFCHVCSWHYPGDFLCFFLSFHIVQVFSLYVSDLRSHVSYI